jgi:integrase/recombinase XerD
MSPGAVAGAQDVGDVDIGRGWLRVWGKGAKERMVPLDGDVAQTIQALLTFLMGK